MKIFATKLVIVLNMITKEPLSVDVVDMTKGGKENLLEVFTKRLNGVIDYYDHKAPPGSEKVPTAFLASGAPFSRTIRDRVIYVVDGDLTVSDQDIKHGEALTVFCWKDFSMIEQLTPRSFDHSADGMQASRLLYRAQEKRIKNFGEYTVNELSSDYGHILDGCFDNNNAYYLVRGELHFQGNLTCEDCGKVSPDVESSGCPFEMDHNQQYVPATLCDSCFNKRQMSEPV